jgi:Flp pilus assembly pilin Flp
MLSLTLIRCDISVPWLPGIAVKAVSKLRRFARAQSGAAVIEFAFALPPLVLLIVGMFEVAVAMFVSTSVENALREASRYGITGNVPAGTTREAQILQIIEDNTLGMLDPATTKITFMKYASFQDVGQPEPFTDTPDPADPKHNGKYDSGEDYVDLNGNSQWDDDRGIAGVGAYGEVVRYKVDYQWHVMTPLLSSMLGDNGVLHMSASVVVRNEPYDVLQAGGG